MIQCCFDAAKIQHFLQSTYTGRQKIALFCTFINFFRDFLYIPMRFEPKNGCIQPARRRRPGLAAASGRKPTARQASTGKKRQAGHGIYVKYRYLRQPTTQRAGHQRHTTRAESWRETARTAMRNGPNGSAKRAATACLARPAAGWAGPCKHKIPPSRPANAWPDASRPPPGGNSDKTLQKWHLNTFSCLNCIKRRKICYLCKSNAARKPPCPSRATDRPRHPCRDHADSNELQTVKYNN